MSFLSATMVCTALIGAGPEVVTSEHTETEQASAATQVVQFHCQQGETASCKPFDAVCAEASLPCSASGGLTDAGEAKGDYSGYTGQPCNASGGLTDAGCPPAGDFGESWCPWCEDDDCEGDCEPSCWDQHLMHYCVGPGDMYPHYPYFPVYHGYYYFRPYNHAHVFRDSALASEMGGDPRAPYSVQFLKTFFPPAPVEEVPEHATRDLPKLEDLLIPPKPEPYTDPMN